MADFLKTAPIVSYDAAKNFRAIVETDAVADGKPRRMALKEAATLPVGANGVVKADGAGKIPLAGVATGSGSDGQVMTLVSGNWAPAAPTGGASSDFIRPEDYAGTTMAKLNSAFAASISGNIPVRLTGAYSITSALTTVSLTAGQTLHVIGDGTITVAANLANPIIIEATWPSAVNISAIAFTTHAFPGTSVTDTECTKITATGHGCAIGDLIKVVSDDTIPGSTLQGSDPRRIGEFAYVGDVSGNDIYISGVLVETYTTSPRLVKIPQSPRLIWDGPTIDHTAGQSWSVTSLLTRGLYRPQVRLSFRNGYHCGLMLQSCFQSQIDVDGWKFLNRTNSLGVAGYIVQDMQGWQTTGRVRALDARHAYTTGSNSSASGGGAAYLNGRTFGARIKVAAVGCSSAAADLHSEAMDCQVDAEAIGGSFGEDSNGAAVQMRGRRNRSIGTVGRNSPHGAQFWAHVDGDCWDCLISDLDYSGYGDAIRVGSASGSILVKRPRIIGGYARVDNNRAVYLQNCSGAVISDMRVALVGSSSGSVFITLNGNAGATLIRPTFDLTDFTGTSADLASFAAASTGNSLTVINPTIIDPNGKLRSWFNGANTSGTVVLLDIPADVPTTGDPTINSDSLSSLTLVYKLSDGDSIRDALLTGTSVEVQERLDDIRTSGAVVSDVPKGRAPTSNVDTGVLEWLTPVNFAAWLGLSGSFEPASAVVAVSGAATDLALIHDRQRLRFTNAAPTLTVRAQADVAYPDNMVLAGTALHGVTITPSAGVTINGAFDSIAVPAEAEATGFVLCRISANSWVCQAGSALSADLIDRNTSVALNVGYPITPSASAAHSSGTYTPDISLGLIQPFTNAGAHTIGVPTWYGQMVLVYTNTGTAGALTMTGWKVSGDPYVTTNGAIFSVTLICLPGFAEAIFSLKS